MARNLDAWMLAVSVALGAGWLALAPGDAPPASSEAPRLSALGAIPAGVRIALTVDVRRVRSTALGEELFGGGRELPGVGRLEEVCGFDPTREVRELGVAIPDARGALELGLVVTGDLQAQRLTQCASAVVARRGGKPAHGQLGTFLSTRDREGSAGEIVVRDGGPLLLGDGRFLRDMIDTVEGRADNLRRDDGHAAIRAALGEDAALVLSWLLPQGWLEAVMESPLAAASPLSRIRALGVAVDVEPRIQVRAVLGCESETVAAEVSRVLAGFRSRLGDLSREELGDDILSQAEFTQDSRVVRARVELDATRVLRIAQHLLSRVERRPLPPPPSAPQDAGADRVSADR